MAEPRKTSWDVTPEDDRNLAVVKKELATKSDVAAVRYSLKVTAQHIERATTRRKKAG